MESLLGEFRRGNIADKDRSREERTIQAHLGKYHAAWGA